LPTDQQVSRYVRTVRPLLFNLLRIGSLLGSRGETAVRFCRFSAGLRRAWPIPARCCGGCYFTPRLFSNDSSSATGTSTVWPMRTTASFLAWISWRRAVSVRNWLRRAAWLTVNIVDGSITVVAVVVAAIVMALLSTSRSIQVCVLVSRPKNGPHFL